MIKIEGARAVSGEVIDHEIEATYDAEIDGSGLTMLPGMIDSHVHFRTPDNWESGARAALAGGVTTVFDMPNHTPPCTTRSRLDEKMALIQRQLAQVEIPLRFGLYLGADREHLDAIEACRTASIGLKIFMGSSTGGLLMDRPSDLERAFALAAQSDLLVAVHAEDEGMIRAKGAGHSHEDHSVIRSPDVAAAACERAIGLAERFGTRLHILHVSSHRELDQIRAAKARGAPVTAEATPHHLFLDTEAYSELGTRALVNPPLRSPEDRQALWEALCDGTIDTVGSDHAPHLLKEKLRPYGEAPSGFPGIETMLPLLLTAAQKGEIPLERVVALLSMNVERIFRLEPTSDAIFVDLTTKQTVTSSTLNSRCGWSPFEGRTLCGWPVYVVASRKPFRITHGSPQALTTSLRH